MSDPIEDEDMTELVDATVPRVDLVKGPAHGLSFLIAKAEMSSAEINDLPDSEFGYIEPGGHKDDEGKTVPRSLRHFPLSDAAHVRNALARASQSPFGEKAMPKIKAAAEKFGVDVAKAADDETATADEVLDDAAPEAARQVLDGAALDAPGDPDDPASPAWEAVDAARARAMVAAVAELKASLALAADREATEAVTGTDPDDADAACDLDDAQAALDYLLGVLAPFAVTEQAEADCRADLFKAADAVAVVKAGRVLSTANLTAVKAAIAALTEVLHAAEPPAPSPEKEAAPVAKTSEDPEAPMTDETVEDVVKAADLSDTSDADLKRMVLTGTGSERSAALAELGLRTITGETAGEPDGDGQEDAAVIPGTDTVQSPVDNDDENVTKAETPAAVPDVDMLKTAFTDALKEALAGQEDVLKTSLASFEERIAKVEATPAPGGPVVSTGSTGTGLLARDGDADQLADLRKAVEQADSPQARSDAAAALTYAEIRARFAR